MKIAAFLDWLTQKYPLPVGLIVNYEVYDVEIFENDSNDSAAYGVVDVVDDIEGITGAAFISIAGKAPIPPIEILAHEYCHIIQMFVWETFPQNMKHPQYDHHLEKEARYFAKRMVEDYSCR